MKATNLIMAVITSKKLHELYDKLDCETRPFELHLEKHSDNWIVHLSTDYKNRNYFEALISKLENE